jgi:tight adherence protein B
VLSLETIVAMSVAYGPFIMVAVATFLFLEALFVAVSRSRSDTRAINKRLKVLAGSADGRAALIKLRRSRGLSADGRYLLPFAGLGHLLLQSGISMPLARTVQLMLGFAIAAGVLAYVLSLPIELCLLVAITLGGVLPILILVALRSRRLKRLEEQLPEAIDVMVRSLRAGHPMPVAIALVSREMPDPIGSEFGMASDETTYGMDLATALSNLRTRVGQSDIALLVVAITIQSRTGGNLAELLGNLARMVRERARVRRKITALSAEGRYSAIALSIVPIAIYLVVTTLAPKYYGDVRDDVAFMPAVYTGMALWLVGVVVMRRMVNFKI